MTMANQTQNNPRDPSYKPQAEQKPALGGTDSKPQGNQQETRTFQLTGLARYIAESEAFLQERGWEKVGVGRSGVSLWKDPNNTKVKEGFQPGPDMKNRDGQQIITRQWVVPPLDWPMSMETALLVEQNKEKEAAKAAG
jgi:hypothetical protein